jgi:cell division inhibitor SepF
MASLWQRTLYYLGLVDEDEAGEYDQPSADERPPPAAPRVRRQQGAATAAGQAEPAVGRRVEPPLTSRRRISTDGALAEAGVIVHGGDTSSVRTVTDEDLESRIVVARSYTDAQALADHIRANLPVVLDLRNVEPAMVRRLVDFASGLTYALGGSMRKIGQGVILVTPANVNVTRDERRRLADLGYYEAPTG